MDTSRNILVFDLETKYLADEVGGWSNISSMGLAAAVTLEVFSGKYMDYLEDDAQSLIDALVNAEVIIGFNLLRFDYEVMRPYGLLIDEPLRSKSIDLLLHVERALGFRLGLNTLAEATLGIGKSADGIDSVQWFRDGKIEKVLKYCRQDVKVTKELYEYGRSHRQVYYHDRFGGKKSIRVNW